MENSDTSEQFDRLDGQKPLLTVVLAALALFLGMTEPFTQLKAPSARPKPAAARKLAKAYPLADRKYNNAMGKRSPFHPAERVIR